MQSTAKISYNTDSLEAAVAERDVIIADLKADLQSLTERRENVDRELSWAISEKERLETTLCGLEEEIQESLWEISLKRCKKLNKKC